MIRSLFYGLLASLLLPVNAGRADTFFSDGVEIYYTDQGQGFPVLLVHGFTFDGARNWGLTGIIAGLAADYRVITVDARGHGQSGKPRDPDAYGDQMVRDLINLLDHLGLPQAHVAGYSMGGAITQQLVTRYSSRVGRAIIGGAGWSGETAGGGANQALIASLEAGNGITPLIIALTPEGEPPPTAEELEAVNHAFMASNDAAALAAVIAGFDELNAVSREALESNEVPLLYLVGELDPLRAEVDRARGVAANAEFIIVPDSDHMTAVSHPLFLASMQQFLDSAESTRVPD